MKNPLNKVRNKNMPVYCKLVEGHLVFAPHKIKIENNIIHDPTGEQLKSQGWKQLIVTIRPEIKEGQYLEVNYIDLGEYILRDWIIKKDNEG